MIATGAMLVAGGCAANRSRSAGETGGASAEARAEDVRASLDAPERVEDARTQQERLLQPAEAASAWATVFPHVDVDRGARRVRVGGFVPIDAHSENTPRVFLEVLVCSRNSKEHEALVVTDAKASHVHAAMLMIGLEPGAPGAWRWGEGASRPEADAPKGPGVRVTVRPVGGEGVEIREWVVQRDGVTRLPAEEHLVFAGSIFRKLGAPGQAREVYGADADGTIVGLTAFGAETIAWTGMYHHDTAVEQPAWIADPKHVPKFGTQVDVLIEPMVP